MALTVMQLLPALQSGGVERGTLEVAEALIGQGHRAIVISAGGALVKPLEALGAEHITCPIGEKSLLTLRFIPKLRQLFQQHQVDIIHARSRLPAWLAYRAWKKMPIAQRPRFMTTMHGLHSINRYSAIMGSGEIVIAVSNTVKDYLMQQFKIPAEKIQVIYRGVDPHQHHYAYQPDATWLAAWHQQYPELQQQPIITLPGRITRRKGHEDFLRMMQQLKQQNIHAWGVIVGGADSKHQPYLQALQQYVQKHQLNVIFTGQRQDIQSIFAMSNIVLSLSIKPESFGRTVLEALSQGIPVIGYDHGGVSEILQQLLPEGAIPLASQVQLTQRVIQFLDNPPEVPHHHPFTLQKMLDKTLDLYTQLASQPHD